jgi:dephospho-CoA kinase
VLRIGLTGGIGAGKSAVAQRLVRLGAVLVDSDVLAREVVAPGTDGLAAVVAEFGPGVLGEDGGLDRPALGARVFGDEPARRALEGIIHPRVRARAAELIAAAPPDAIVVNDVPLLVEAGLAATFQLVVVVTAAEVIRVERLVRTRGMTEAEAYARITAQATEERRRDAADALVVNDGTLAELEAVVDALWRDRLVPYEANLRAGHRAPRRRTPAVVDADPCWPARARRLIARLATAGDRSVRVDHIGSTSVPGLPATDVIDIQVVVADLAAAARVAAAVPAAGFVRLPGRRYRMDRRGGAHEECVAVEADPGRPVNIDIRPVTAPLWREALLFRDWLRADATARDEYAAVKRELAARPGIDVDGYEREKPRWIAAALERAETWAAATGWAPEAPDQAPTAAGPAPEAPVAAPEPPGR